MSLAGRTLINEGTLNFRNGDIEMSEGAKIENSGTFEANSESGDGEFGDGGPEIGYEPVKGAAPSIINTGTFEKTEGTRSTEIAVKLENHGPVKAQTGYLAFTGGGSSSSATWTASEGTHIGLNGGTFSLSGGGWAGPGTFNVEANVTSEEVATSGGVSITLGSGSLAVKGNALTVNALTVKGGMLELDDASPSSTVSSLTMSGGSLSGVGPVHVSSSFEWTASGSISGSGSVVLASGSTSVLEGGTMSLAGRTLINEGTLNFRNGDIEMSEGAKIENSGTFEANSESGDGEFGDGGPEIGYEPVKGAAPSIINTGTFEKTEGTRSTEIAVKLENHGPVKAQTGYLAFTGGGSSSSATWTASEGTHIGLNGGTFSLSGGGWAGPGTFNVEANVTSEEVATSGGVSITLGSGSLAVKGNALTVNALTVKGGMLELDDASPSSTVSSLTMSGGSLSGVGPVHVSSSFEWTASGSISGSGSVVLASGSTSVLEGGTMSLAGRTLINEGTLNFRNGDIEMSEGAKIENSGTFEANSESGDGEFGDGGSKKSATNP